MTSNIDRAVFDAAKAIEAGTPKQQAIDTAADAHSVPAAQVADYFNLVLLPHERSAMRRPR